MERRVIFYLCVLLSLVLLACERHKVVAPRNDDSTNADTVQTISIGAYFQNLIINDYDFQVDQGGTLIGKWELGDVAINGAGLWIAAEHQGVVYSDCAMHVLKSNYTTIWGDNRVGVVLVDKKTDFSTLTWPTSYGAPITAAGEPLVYGDAMCWSALTSDTTDSTVSFSLFEHPIPNLRVTQAVFGYNDIDILYIRYEITNLSDESFNDMYAGFYRDADIGNYYSRDRTGYDLARELSFTYSDSSCMHYVFEDSCDCCCHCDSIGFCAAGYTFLETPKNVGTSSHRIIRRYNYVDPDFAEKEITTSQQVLDALKGLSNSGQPMVNPLTGEVTRYAFTGDPVGQTGWLDTRMDVRSLISSGPFDLKAGETVVLTQAWAISDGASLGEAIDGLKSKIDQIRAEPELWQFQ